MEYAYEDLEKRISELERMELIYKASIDKYEVLFNQNTDAVVIINPKDASLIEFNDQLCKQLGYTREELFKLKIPDIEALESIEETNKRIQSIMNNGSATFETKHRTKSGEVRDVLVIAQYLTLNNEHIYHCIWRDITESKKVEQHKNEGYHLLKNLAENVPGFIYQYRYHPDGRNYFPFATEHIYHIYEVTPEEVKYDASKVLSRLHPEDHDSVIAKIVHSYETLEVWEDIYRVNLPIRGVRWLHGVAKPQKMDDGSVLWHGYISDITEKKNAEEIIRISELKLKSYLNSSPIGIFVADSHGKYIDLNPAACEITGYDREELLKMTIKDILNPIDYDKGLEHFNTLKSKGFADGVFMGTKKNGEQFWLSVVATKIDDNNLIGYSRDVTHIILSDRKLRESEAQLDNAMKLARMGNWVLDVESGIFTFNDNFYSIFDTDAEEMGGYTMSIQEYQDKFVHLEDRNAVVREANFTIKENNPNYNRLSQSTIKALNGSIKNIAIRIFNEFDENGKIVRIFGVNQDITELKEAEKELQIAKEKAEDSENHLKTLVKSMPDLVWLKDINGRYLSCNYRFEELMGVKESELIGKTDYDFTDKETADFFVGNDRKVIESGLTNINEELLTFASDGHKEYTETIKTPVYGKNKEIIGVLGIGRDITHRKEQESEILRAKNVAEENERKLNAVNEIAKIGYWELNQETKIFTFTDNFYNIFKTSVNEMGGYQVPLEFYANKFLHPADAHLVAEENRKALETNDPNYTSTLEHRIIFSDGSIGYMSVKIFVIKDENGETVKTYGVNQDITDRKIKEEEIKKLNEKYKSFISNSTEAVYCLEFDKPIDLNLPIEEQVDNIYKYGYIGHCNLTIAKMYGLESVEDFLNKRVVDIHGGNDNPQNRDTFRQFLLNNCRTQDLETEEVGIEGQTLYFMNNDNGVIENGKLLRIWGTARDITERKKDEQELIKAKTRAEASEGIIRGLFENTQIGLLYCNAEGKIIEANKTILKMLGSPSLEHSKQINLLTFQPLIESGFSSNLTNCINQKEIIFDENEYISKWGKSVYIKYQFIPIIANEKVIGVWVNLNDVTDLWNSKKEISIARNIAEENERQMHKAQNTAKIGNWVWYIQENKVWWSDEMYNIFDVDKNTFTGDLAQVINDAIHPDDRARVEQSNLSVIRDNKPMPVEYRVILKNGVEKYVLGLADEIILDENGHSEILTGIVKDITDYKVIQLELLNEKQKLEKSEQRLQTIFDTLSEGVALNEIVYDDNGEMVDYRILEVNKSFYRVSNLDTSVKVAGKLATQFYGMNKEFIKDFWIGHKDNKNSVTTLFKSPVEEKWFHISTSPFFDNKFITTFFDITDRVLAESALIKAKENAEESEKQLKAILDNTLYPITLTTTSGNLVFINNAALEYFEIDSAEKFMGEAVTRFWKNPENRNNFLSQLYSDGYVYDYQNSYITDNNNEKIVLVTSNLLDYKGEKVILAIYKDITERIKIENELIKAKEKAEESDRLKSAFLCNVSHEIRTPLNAIVGFSALLNDDDLTHEERASFNNIIKSRSNDLLNIINDILDISQIEANQMKVNVTEGKVGDLVDEIYKTFKLKKNVENKDHIELKIEEIFDPKHDLIKTDFHRVKQIISNFLTNAFKFTKQGSISIGSKLLNNEILFYVSDTGIGISPEDLPKVFERFRQIEYSDKRNYGGNGLGLSISSGLAQLLGGRIWAESELNVGSTFYLSIPYDPVNQTNKNVISDNESKQSTIVHKILIVEDDQYNLFFLEKLVKSLGYKYISAKNGMIAIEKFKENTDIDLILLDIQLPDISGMDLLQIFKTERFEVPVIAQTAFAMEEDKVRILESGCDDYISKPIMRDILFKKLKQFLG